MTLSKMQIRLASFDQTFIYQKIGQDATLNSCPALHTRAKKNLRFARIFLFNMFSKNTMVRLAAAIFAVCCCISSHASAQRFNINAYPELVTLQQRAVCY